MNCGSESSFWCFLEYSKNKTLEMRNASVSFRFALYWPRRTNELQLPREKRHKLVDSFLPIGIHLASERDLVKQHSNSRYTYIKLMITFLKKIWLSNVWNIQQHQFAVSFVTWMGDSDRLYPWIRGGMISKYYFILI